MTFTRKLYVIILKIYLDTKHSKATVLQTRRLGYKHTPRRFAVVNKW